MEEQSYTLCASCPVVHQFTKREARRCCFIRAHGNELRFTAFNALRLIIEKTLKRKEKKNNNSGADDERRPYIMSVYYEQQLRIIKLTKPSIIAFKANEKGSAINLGTRSTE